ncbi:hypothetical protein L596_024658 [Steinernema carpocapsae]|uniref:G-protein coupled receptors family 1 profile domain-containing protein n=1 Tax=Steinernema carpocapsae TaxID=34508 RepID=A0A4U5M5H8_STECR|nr:hypothetical protein L596_024658 [Steinernema carpocapsae]
MLDEISYEGLFNLLSYTIVAYTAIAVCSIFLNGTLVVATIKSPQLRSMCNILIAIQAVMDTSLNCCCFMYMYLLQNQETILDRLCYFLNFEMFYAMNVSTLLMLWIGIDRLLCVKYTAWYKRLVFSYYLAFILFTCFLYSTSIMTLGYLTLKDEPEFCTVSFAFNGLGRDIWSLCQFGINIAVIVVYTMLKREIQKQVTNSKASKQLTKSLYTVMVLYILGWVTTMSALIVIKIFTNRYAKLERNLKNLILAKT